MCFYSIGRFICILFDVGCECPSKCEGQIKVSEYFNANICLQHCLEARFPEIWEKGVNA
jgi:hypothetical protein